MKRIIAVVLAVVMIVSLSACGKEQTAENGSKAEKYCFNCGEGIAKDVAFCEHCGTAQNNTNKDNSSDNSSTDGAYSTPADTSEAPTSSEPTESSQPVESIKPTPPAHTHSYSKKVTTATCTDKGYTTYTCSCGHTYKDNYTNPAHKYSNYKCTKCGSVDKSHAYDYLLQWIQAHGTASGEYVSIYEYPSPGMQFGVCYNVSYDKIYIALALYNDNAELEFDIFLYLKTEDQKFEYSAGFSTPTILFGTGKIDGKTYTENSPLPCDGYIGDDSLRNQFVETARLYVNEALKLLETYLSKSIPDITLNDLGFEKF